MPEHLIALVKTVSFPLFGKVVYQELDIIFLIRGSNDRLNQVVLQKVISTRKMELIEELQIMDSKDVLLYKKLASQINVFLDTKEAIRKAVIEESLVRKDLMRCIQDNKQATRKLTLGNISVEK